MRPQAIDVADHQHRDDRVRRGADILVDVAEILAQLVAGGRKQGRPARGADRRCDDEGLEAVIALEKQRGYVEAQQQMTTYLSSKVWVPLWDLLTERLASIDPDNSVVFLTRVAAMSPGIFHMSMLLDKMHGKTKAATVLFYPGSIEGTTGLRFMDLKDREALGNYRVKIYG